ncbi:MAG: transcriptional repressor LexA [Ruminococcaceae bacterium]|nr:transcriptional repressor LexA [Oscillospiraceae bacterium]
MKLTDKERALYEFISKKIKSEGFAPSVRDISAALGWKSTSTVHAYLERLEEKGLIRRESNKSRALKVENDTSDKASMPKGKVPLLGQIAAGSPILAEENLEGYIDFVSPNIHADPTSLFALRVKGESMIEAGILDGDIIVIQKCEYAENGQIIAALVNNEATVKTFYKENGHFRLQPENSTMEPIIVNEVIVLGKVIACLRYY